MRETILGALEVRPSYISTRSGSLLYNQQKVLLTRKKASDFGLFAPRASELAFCRLVSSSLLPSVLSDLAPRWSFAVLSLVPPLRGNAESRRHRDKGVILHRLPQ